MDDRPRHIFLRSVPIFKGSKIFRRPSAIDVRLTASDKIHNLIIQNATEEYVKLKGPKVVKKEEFKPLDMLAPTDPVRKIQDLIPKPPPVSDQLPKLGIPELDDPQTEAATKESSKEIMSFTYTVPTSSSISQQLEESATEATSTSDKTQKRSKKPTAQPQTAGYKPGAKSGVTHKDKSGKVPPKRAIKTLGRKYRKGKVVPKHIEDKPKVIDRPRRVSISTDRKDDLRELKSAPTSKALEGEEHFDETVFSAMGWDIRPASLINLYEADTLSIPSWINNIWVEDLEKRISKSEISVHTIKDGSPSEVQQRLEDIRTHLRSRNEEEYHPYAKRKTKRGITNWGAIALILKALLGSGVLRMPMVFGYIGHYTAVIPTVLLLVWISVTFHLYIRARQCICKILRKPYLSFSDTMKESFIIGPRIFRGLGKHCETFFDIMIIFHQIAVTMKYGIFICGYAILIFESPTYGVTAPFFAIPVMWVVIVIHYIKSMSNFVCIAVIANITSCAYYGVILFQLTGNYHRPSDQYIWTPDDYNSCFYFIGHFVAVTDCIVTTLIVEAKMKYPRQIVGYSGIMNICLMFSALWYIMMGFFGGTQFGREATLDYLKHLDLPDSVYKGLFVAYTFALTVSCCIQAFYPMHILWGACLRTSIRKNPHKRAWQYFLRTSYALVPFLAIHLPTFIVYFIMFFGYISGPFLMLFCPVVAHFCMFWTKRDIASCRLMVTVDLFLLLFALLAMVSSVIWYVEKFEFKLVWTSH